jgi:hypothetical protein
MSQRGKDRGGPRVEVPIEETIVALPRLYRIFRPAVEGEEPGLPLDELLRGIELARSHDHGHSCVLEVEAVELVALGRIGALVTAYRAGLHDA